MDKDATHVQLRRAWTDEIGAISTFLSDYFPAMAEPVWYHIWQNNPFIQTENDRSPGWILLSSKDDSIVGFLGKISLEYEWNGQRLRAATITSVAVAQEYRKHSLRLFARFFAQEDVDLFLNTTANRAVGKILAGFKAKRVPRSDYDRPFTWIVDRMRFSEGFLKSKGVPGVSFLKFVGSAALGVRETFSPRCPTPTVGAEIQQITCWDERFDELWQVQRQRSNTIQAVRSANALNWHYRLLQQEKRLVVFGLESNRHLDGYIILMRRDVPETDLTRLLIADMQLRHECVRSVELLLATTMEWARETGIDLVESVGFNDFKQKVMSRFSPLRRRFPAWPFYYKSKDQDIQEKLELSDTWDPCLFDGDASLW